jgi:hypothetical protein
MLEPPWRFELQTYALRERRTLSGQTLKACAARGDGAHQCVRLHGGLGNSADFLLTAQLTTMGNSGDDEAQDLEPKPMLGVITA